MDVDFQCNLDPSWVHIKFKPLIHMFIPKPHQDPMQGEDGNVELDYGKKKFIY